MAPTPMTTVYILTRNRLPLLRQAIVSVLAQDVPVRLVVSDNSTDDESWQLVKREFPNVQVYRREPPLTVYAHFNTVMAEVSTPYLVMFHDDDVMLPGFVRTLEAQLSQREDLAGVACNASRLQDETVEQSTVMGHFSQPLDINSPKALLSHYLKKLPLGPAPFPAYMYRVEAIRGLRLVPDEGGKYADVSFLCKVAERGSLRWIPEALMQYRYHAGNDSKVPDMSATRALIRFVVKRYGVRRQDSQLRQFRYRMWRQWIAEVDRHSELAQRYPWRLRVARREVRLGFGKLALLEPQLAGAIVRSLLARANRIGK